MRLKSGQTSNCGEQGESAFYNLSDWVTFAVSVVRCLHPFSGENASELEETFGWKTEIRWPASADAREHRAGELDVIKIRTWNTIVG